MVRPETSTPTSLSPHVTLQYIGHSCFSIVAPDGTRVITDPYGCAVPDLPFPDDIQADLVTVSHGHDAHIQVHAVKGEPVTLCGGTCNSVGMVRVASYDTLHGEWRGRYMGVNRVFVFRIGDVKIVHLGDLGRIESQEVFRAIEDADVVLAPAGEAGTMPCEQLNELMDRVNARTVVPRHFAVSAKGYYRDLSIIATYITSLPPGTVITDADELAVKPQMPRQVTLLTIRALGERPVQDAACASAPLAASSRPVLPRFGPPSGLWYTRVSAAIHETGGAAATQRRSSELRPRRASGRHKYRRH
jgi:L-ascorbate metabolism protein UlaG (beta-lactamase superfamily)